MTDFLTKCAHALLTFLEHHFSLRRRRTKRRQARALRAPLKNFFPILGVQKPFSLEKMRHVLYVHRPCNELMSCSTTLLSVFSLNESDRPEEQDFFSAGAPAGSGAEPQPGSGAGPGAPAGCGAEPREENFGLLWA